MHVTVDGNNIIEFSANGNHPFTAGRLCEKMENFPGDVTFHPDRILTPLKRSGEKGEGVFEKISWEQAIAEVAEKLKTIITEKGGSDLAK